MPLHIQTPLFQSRQLSQLCGRAIWLKMDALQVPGSFKIRGIGHACSEYVRRGARRFVSSSGGNAGLAVAYAGRLMGVPVTVVVPQTTSQHAQALLKLEDADVIVHGSSWQEANELAQSLVGPTDAFLHPFDDPLLWHGHASIIDEVAATGFTPDAVVLSVGGGGLLSGVAEGLHRNGWSGIPIVAVETEGAASFHEAAKAGHAVQLEQINSIATSLGAKRVCDQAVKWSHEHPIHSVLVSDKSAVVACERSLADHRVLVEPACGASLALAYENSPALDTFKTILVVVCGGATTTAKQLQQWSQDL
nr:pyridoxal-phosphate dependent enzyme [uncultured Rhodoferax sp.]